MTIEFNIEREQHELMLDATRPESISRFAVLVLDGDRVGRVSELLKENPSSEERSTLAASYEGQKILFLNVDLKRVTWNKYAIVMKQKEFLFQENRQGRYAKSRYGYFRVSNDGKCSLEDLADASFQLLSR